MRNIIQSLDTAGSRRLQKEQAVAAILAEYRASGLTQRVFAQAAGLSVSTLQSWLRRARLGADSPAWRPHRAPAAPAVSLLEIELEGATPFRESASVRYEIELGNGARLRVPPAFAEVDVRRLLSLLQEVR